MKKEQLEDVIQLLKSIETNESNSSGNTSLKTLKPLMISLSKDANLPGLTSIFEEEEPDQIIPWILAAVVLGFILGRL